MPKCWGESAAFLTKQKARGEYRSTLDEILRLSQFAKTCQAASGVAVAVESLEAILQRTWSPQGHVLHPRQHSLQGKRWWPAESGPQLEAKVVPDRPRHGAWTFVAAAACP